MDLEIFVREKLNDIEKKLEQMDIKQDAMLVQTTKTNGRLLRVEGWQKAFNKFIWSAIGGLCVVAGFYIQNYINKH